MANENTKTKPSDTAPGAPSTGFSLAGIASAYKPEGTTESYSVDWSAVPASSVKYALETSLSKIVGNSASNVASNTKAKLVRDALGDYTRTKGADHSVRDASEAQWLKDNSATVDAAVATGQADARKAAYAAILDGTIAERARANSADPLSIFVDTVLANAVRNHAAKTGQPIPQGAEMTKAKKAVMELHGEAKVREKAQALLGASSL